MDYQGFLRLAQRGEIPPVLLLHGADAQLLDDALDLLADRLFADAATAALGREVLDGRETSGEAVVNAAMTLPLMTGIRLVVVRDAQTLPARHAGVLSAYVREPNPTSRLVLAARESLRVSRERRAEHWLLGVVPGTAVVDLPARQGRELAAWLRQRAALEGLRVDEDAARLLIEWVGEETMTLLGEARKAALAGGVDSRAVSVREVTAIVGEHRVSDVFELTRSVQRRELGPALKTLDRVLATEEPMRALALLTRDVRLACSVRALRDRGQSPEQIARALRIPPGVVVETLERSGSAATLARRLERCWEVERRVKSSGVPRAELTALVAELCVER